MRCPICKRETVFEDNPFRPFCSERCKLIDLDNWLAGRYRVSTPVVSAEEVAESDEVARSELGQRDLNAGE
ncbi:MAG TPA: DNA gyrase inhibitor YacG [Terriglobia bacterium]